MSKVHQRGPARAELNLTPLIDVTFQLIIFFMLVNNIVSVQALEMLVPELSEPQTREIVEGERVVVNVGWINAATVAARQKGDIPPLDVDGTAELVQIGNERFLPATLGSMDRPGGTVVTSLEEAKRANPDVEVLLRADGALYYDQVAPIMQAITQAQIGKIEVVALKPEGGAGESQEEAPQP